MILLNNKATGKWGRFFNIYERFDALRLGRDALLFIGRFIDCTADDARGLLLVRSSFRLAILARFLYTSRSLLAFRRRLSVINLSLNQCSRDRINKDHLFSISFSDTMTNEKSAWTEEARAFVLLQISIVPVAFPFRRQKLKNIEADLGFFFCDLCRCTSRTHPRVYYYFNRPPPQISSVLLIFNLERIFVPPRKHTTGYLIVLRATNSTFYRRRSEQKSTPEKCNNFLLNCFFFLQKKFIKFIRLYRFYT